MIMIVGYHFAHHGGFVFESGEITVPRLWLSFLDMGGEFAVDVFVLISGYFLIENKDRLFDVRKCAKLWGQVFFYSVLFFIIGVLTGFIDFSKLGMIGSLLPVSTNKWWFASFYFVLFLLHPFLNKLLYALKKRQYQRLLILLLVIWCIIPTLTNSKFSSNPLWEFVLLYMIAGYIRLYGIHPKFSAKHYALIWLLLTILTFASAVLIMLLGRWNPVFNSYTTLFYGTMKLPTLFRAIAFFMIFKCLKPSHAAFVNVISLATFGVYLLHDSDYMRFMLWNRIFQNASYRDTVFIIPYSIGVIALVYIACTVVEFIRIYSVELLYMKMIDGSLSGIKKAVRAFSNAFGKLFFGREE